MPPFAVLDGVALGGVDQDDQRTSDEDRRGGEGETGEKPLRAFVVLAVRVRFIFSPTVFGVNPC